MSLIIKSFSLLIIIFFLLFIATDPAMAHGGIEKVSTFIASLLTVLKAISIGVVTIAIMWAGYKFLFKQADMTECAKIIGGGLLIGAAAEIAAYLLV